MLTFSYTIKVSGLFIPNITVKTKYSTKSNGYNKVDTCKKLYHSLQNLCSYSFSFTAMLEYPTLIFLGEPQLFLENPEGVQFSRRYCQLPRLEVFNCCDVYRSGIRALMFPLRYFLDEVMLLLVARSGILGKSTHTDGCND